MPPQGCLLHAVADHRNGSGTALLGHLSQKQKLRQNEAVSIAWSSPIDLCSARAPQPCNEVSASFKHCSHEQEISSGPLELSSYL